MRPEKENGTDPGKQVIREDHTKSENRLIRKDHTKPEDHPIREDHMKPEKEIQERDTGKRYRKQILKSCRHKKSRPGFPGRLFSGKISVFQERFLTFVSSFLNLF